MGAKRALLCRWLLQHAPALRQDGLVVLARATDVRLGLCTGVDRRLDAGGRVDGQRRRPLRPARPPRAQLRTLRGPAGGARVPDGGQRGRGLERGPHLQGPRHRDVALHHPPRRHHREPVLHLRNLQLEHAAHHRAARHRLSHHAVRDALPHGRHHQRPPGAQLRRQAALQAAVPGHATGGALRQQRRLLPGNRRHGRPLGPKVDPSLRPADGEAARRAAALDRRGGHRHLAGQRPAPPRARRQEPRHVPDADAGRAGAQQAADHGRYGALVRGQHVARGGGRRALGRLVLP
mmetsp:Transcript_55682/g.121220  ORF Transcript_55682/g.121220 Transcript_55682/m.121220 type:complete len:292 (+) Transcript_55682:870-1745(+)